MPITLNRRFLPSLLLLLVAPCLCPAQSPASPFDKAALAWNLPWDADWVTAVCVVGPNRVAAGNNLGQILVWELPDKAGGPVPAPVAPEQTPVIETLLLIRQPRRLEQVNKDWPLDKLLQVGAEKLKLQINEEKREKLKTTIEGEKS